MAAAGDVRAGRAYVELGTEESKFIAGLRSALNRVRSWAKDATEIGSRVSLLGAGGVAGLTAIAKGFSEAGVQAAKLRAQTGLSADAVSGLVQAAENSEVAVSALVPAIAKLQLALNKGGSGVSSAFEALGISLDAARAGGLASTIGMIADRLPEVADETKRVAIANALFGKSGYQLLPVLQAGSQGLADAAAQARALGVALDDDALEAAGELDDTFDALSASITGMRNAIGQSIAGALIPYADALTRTVAAGGEWLKQNPAIAQLAFHASVGIAALGAAIAAVGATVLAVTSPVILITGLIVGIGTAALAVTDALGVTDAGFKDLWNSIRVGGQGLGTWFEKLWVFVSDGFELLFARLVASATRVASELRKIFGKDDPFQDFADDFLLSNYKVIIDSGQARLDERIAEINAKDPNDGTGGVSFDRSAAFAALGKIGEQITSKVSGALGGLDLGQSLRAELEGLRASEFTSPEALAGLEAGPSIVAATASRSTADVVGSFSAAAADRLGVGGTLQERQVKAAEDTARNTQKILEELRTNAGGLAFE